MKMKWLNRILNIIIGSLAAVFIGYGIHVYWDYQTHPDMYAIQSAPWYTTILICGIITLTILAVCFALKYIIRKRLN